jgi:glycosyltransferase involved in cell wall biosynthesis
MPHVPQSRSEPLPSWQPWLAFRRASHRRRRARHLDTWPIREEAKQPPAGWPGWPGHKQFTCVLTHDVEGPAGLAHCRRLAECESALGFRSAFYLAPAETDGALASLRTWLDERGFEVGVLDAQREPRWFPLRRRAERQAARLNHSLNQWPGSGFRAKFPPKNPARLDLLDLAYDSSAADTGLFGPGSSGAGTMFPHWVARAANRRSAGGAAGYVELPRTLPDDTTVFLDLGETSPELWIRKLDWIAAHGGMALINVHPQCVRFEGEPDSPRTYPVEHYLALLRHIREKYSGLFWQPLPRQVAAHVRDMNPRPVPVRTRRIAMVTHSFYESDGRVTRYAEALASRGDTVEVFALRRQPDLPVNERIRGVNLHRIQSRYTKSAQSRFSYLWPLIRFLAVSSWELTRRQLRQPYDLVHVHNIPDFLVFAAWFPRWRGAGVILDIHDIVPEFYGSKFATNEGLVLTALKWIERHSARFASQVIVSNDLWLEKFAARTGTRDKCSVFINNVDSETFRPALRTRHDGPVTVLFPGGLQWHQGLDLALRAFQIVHAEMPEAEFHIYGDGNMKPALISLASELGLDHQVRFFCPVRTTDIAGIMANADLGVVPKRADSFGNEAYSTKIMEFMSLGVPVVVSRTQIDQFYFNDSVVCFFESGNVPALAAAMLKVLRDGAARRRMVARAIDFSRQNSWESRKADYLSLVDRCSASSAFAHAS